MPLPKIRSIEFVPGLDPGADNVDVQVKLEDGTFSSFVVADLSEPSKTMERESLSYRYGTPVLYVKTLDKDGVREAVEALAREMGGYWLRYYNSLGDLSAAARDLKLRKPEA